MAEAHTHTTAQPFVRSSGTSEHQHVKIHETQSLSRLTSSISAMMLSTLA